VRIRERRPGDEEAMSRVKDAAGTLGWGHMFPSEARWPELPDRWFDDGVTVLLAEDDGEIVGFAVVRASGDDDASPQTGELDGLYTDPSVWGQGVGRVLHDEAVARLTAAGFEDATLWTAEENHRPRRIYERAGWTPDGAARTRHMYGVDFVELRYRRALG
jgi:GNAT superfamily N-acetyltransferase